MRGASEVPADVLRAAKEASDAFASSRVYVPMEVFIARAIMADRLARPVDTGREKALEEAARIAYDAARIPARKFMRRGMGLPYPVTSKPLALQALRIAAAIRALANPENGRG